MAQVHLQRPGEIVRIAPKVPHAVNSLTLTVAEASNFVAHYDPWVPILASTIKSAVKNGRHLYNSGHALAKIAALDVAAKNAFIVNVSGCERYYILCAKVGEGLVFLGVFKCPFQQTPINTKDSLKVNTKNRAFDLTDSAATFLRGGVTGPAMWVNLPRTSATLAMASGKPFVAGSFFHIRPSIPRRLYSIRWGNTVRFHLL